MKSKLLKRYACGVLCVSMLVLVITRKRLCNRRFSGLHNLR